MPVAIGAPGISRNYVDDDLAQDRMLLSLFKEVQQAQINSASAKKSKAHKSAQTSVTKQFQQKAKEKVQTGNCCSQGDQEVLEVYEAAHS
jgi:hypothetical protein